MNNRRELLINHLFLFGESDYSEVLQKCIDHVSQVSCCCLYIIDFQKYIYRYGGRPLKGSVFLQMVKIAGDEFPLSVKGKDPLKIY